ncbi:MAG TPA: FAD-dependent oxidoreductase, partial [Burkholderiales bacterium]
MSRARLLVVGLVALAFVVFLAAGGPRYFTFENLKAQQAALESWRALYPWQTMAGFFVLYVAFTSASLPAASLLTILAGAIFGFGWGVLLVSFASAIGATVAMLAARFVLRDWVQARFGAQLRGINQGVEREGGFYLFTLRLIPAVPYFLINLAMGLTPIRPWTYYWVSQLAMFPATLLYVNAGTQLARLDSPRGILSWQLIGAFVLLGFFPLLAKKAVEAFRARRVYARWPRPRRFERNLIVIGAGSAGLVAAYIAAVVRAKVTLVEKDRMGGDCLNTGCVPSKALIKSARVLSQIKNSRKFGIRQATADFDFADVMERVQRVVRTVEPHDSVERYTQLGVECLHGTARITSPWTVEIDGKPLTTRAIVIAAGARPLVPKIPGIENVEVLTSENVWNLRKLPPRLAVLGGGPIGCEL